MTSSAKERVLARYPGHHVYPPCEVDPYWVLLDHVHHVVIGFGESEFRAYESAASKLTPEPVERDVCEVCQGKGCCNCAGTGRIPEEAYCSECGNEDVIGCDCGTYDHRPAAHNPSKQSSAPVARKDETFICPRCDWAFPGVHGTYARNRYEQERKCCDACESTVPDAPQPAAAEGREAITPHRFASIMQRELEANSHKGNWNLWNPDEKKRINELQYHLDKLMAACCTRPGAWREPIMGWSIGFDEEWNRDIGYGVPAYWNQPDCDEETDRGLAHVCADQSPRGGDGCGLYFCDKHLGFYGHGVDSGCDALKSKEPFDPKPEHLEWLDFKATDSS